MSTNNKILRIYKSRTTILELLGDRDFITSDYEEFNINEIDSMYKNNQLDMLVKTKDDSKKTYVKYFISDKMLKAQTIDLIIDDLYVLEDVLTPNDNLILIIDGEPNETITSKLRYIYENNGFYVIVYNMQRLQFNILHHKLVPKMTVLKDTEVEELKKTHKLKSLKQLPEISRFDPQAMALFMKPGDVCHIKRDSITAMEYDYYRVCV